jgi:hypothetical protein
VENAASVGVGRIWMEVYLVHHQKWVREVISSCIARRFFINSMNLKIKPI